MNQPANSIRTQAAMLSEVPRARPVRLVADTFEAFRVHSDQSLRHIATAETLDECVEAAAGKLVHKDSFVVIQGSTWRVFVVRQRKPEWQDVGGIPTRCQRLYAEPVTAFRIEAELTRKDQVNG